MSERRRVDFHVHYNPADEQTAYDAIRIAKERNVIAMTILARSQVSENTTEFIKYGESIGVHVVPGVEFLARVETTSIDLIFLGFDPQSSELKEYFGNKYSNKEKGDANKRLAKFQREFLEGKGYLYDGLDEKQIELFQKLNSGELSEKAFPFCWIAASLPENFHLVEKLKVELPEEWKRINLKYGKMPNYIDDPKKLDAKLMYNHYFAVGKEGYYEVRTEAKKIIPVIHRAGGVAIYSPEGEFKIEIWKELQKAGIDGIMAWHAGILGANGRDVPDISKDVVVKARKVGLLVLGGSDYQQLDWELGIGNGNMFVSPKRYEELITYIKNKNNGVLPWKK